MASAKITGADGSSGLGGGQTSSPPELVQSFSPPDDREKHGFGSKAERLAAEALELDMAKWMEFDPSVDDIRHFEKFLKMNPPSRTESSDGIGWVCVRAPHYGLDSEEDDDVEGLEGAWEDLQGSGRPINHEVIFDLAKAHRCLAGKWCVHVDSGFKVDHAWRRIARAVVSGHCGTAAKVSAHRSDARGREENHVICVYNNDFSDRDAVFELEASLRSEAGIKCSMAYKPDAFTYLGVYRGNEWNIRPCIYRSVYDCFQRKSTVTVVYS